MSQPAISSTFVLSKNKIASLKQDPEKTADVAHLKYVHDNEPGIRRIKRGKSFIYLVKNKPLKSKQELLRIKKLVIPPAWENVWICRYDNGHLQATGVDQKKRKQYRYHTMWNVLRNQTKFYRLVEFGKALPLIRARVEKDLSQHGLPLTKVLAAVVSLMERSSIRIGNNMYEKLYGSYGLTTLKDKHVKIHGDHIDFLFKGKKGVIQKIKVKSRKLAHIVKQCKDIPGKELFQFYDHNGKHHCIDSGMVNHYLKEITGKDFSAKDFRTWSGTLHALMAFRDIGSAQTSAATKRNIVAALDEVAAHLGNTRTVCKKYYVHPAIISLYENKNLDRYIKHLDKNEKRSGSHGLTNEEKALMKILAKENATLA